MGGLDLSHVDWIAVQVAAERPGFDLWLDDLGFGPDSRRSPPVAFEPNRRAAHYVLSMKGALRVWVSGKEIDVNTFAGLPKQPFTVRAVDLNNNRLVTDDGLRNLEALKDLRSLDLKGTSVTDRGLQRLQGLTYLRYLRMHGTQVTGAGFAKLGSLTNLSELNLDYTKTDDEGVKRIARLSGLKVLRLGGTEVTDQGLEHVGALTGLEFLCVGGNTRVTGSGLRYLVRLPRLEALSLFSAQTERQGDEATC